MIKNNDLYFIILYFITIHTKLLILYYIRSDKNHKYNYIYIKKKNNIQKNKNKFQFLK